MSGCGSRMWPVWGGCEASGPVNTGAFIPSLLFSGVQDHSSGPRGGGPRPAPTAEAGRPAQLTRLVFLLLPECSSSLVRKKNKTKNSYLVSVISLVTLIYNLVTP